jgi:beta-lactamase regulating signal transducer with metallopeptidase domain
MIDPLLSRAELLLVLLTRAAWQAGLLALIVLALTWLLRGRLDARWRFGLWMVVFARLAMPILPAAPWSVFHFVGQTELPGVGRSGTPSYTAEPSGPQQSPLRMTAAMDLPAAPSADWPGMGVPQPVDPDPSALPPAELTPAVAAEGPPPAEVSWLRIATIVWLAGVVLLTMRHVVTSLQLRRARRTWQPDADGDLTAALEGCRRDLRLRRAVRLALSPGNVGPATCGILRPCIVLPRRLVASLSPAELRLVLLHELVHVRRFDVLWDRLATLAAIVHWFHPVGWLARFFLRKDRELACDAAVLDRSGAQAAPRYGHAIIKTVETLLMPSPAPGLVGMFSRRPRSFLERRIRLIAGYRKATWPSLAAGGAVLLVLVLVGLTDAQSKSRARDATAAEKEEPFRDEPKEEPKEEKQARSLLEKAEKSAASIEDAAQKAWALMNIATAGAKLGSVRHAVEVFEQAAASAEAIPETEKYRRGGTLMLIAKAQADAGEWRAAANTAERSETPSQNCKEWALAHLASAQARAGKLETALATVDSISAGEQSFALKLVSDRQLEAGDLKGALETAGRIKDGHYKVQALAIVATAQAKAGDNEPAEETLRKALEVQESLKDSNPDIETSRQAGSRTRIAIAMVQMGNESRALEIAKPLESSMKHEQVMAEVALTRFRAGKVDEALEMLTPFRGSWKEDAQREIARLQVQARDFTAARKTIDMMSLSTQKTDALIQMAAEHVKRGDTAAAKLIFEEVANAAVKRADVLWTAGPMSAVPMMLHQAAVAWGEADAKSATAWAEKLESPFVRAYVFAAIAEGMANRKPAAKLVTGGAGKAPKVDAKAKEGDEKPIAIRGRVIDAKGRGVPKADLWLPLRFEPASEVTGQANERGEFQLTIPPGSLDPVMTRNRWTLWAHAKGHSPATTSLWRVLFKQSDEPIEIQLGADPTTSFVVSDPDGRPATGVTVSPFWLLIETRNHAHPPDPLRERLTAVTDKNGRVTLPLARQGLSSVELSSAEWGQQVRNLDASEQQGASRDIPVRLRHVGRIEARVTGEKAEWARGIKFYLQTARLGGRGITEGHLSIETDGDGRFVVPKMPPGRLKVYGSVDQRLPVRLSLPRDADVKAGATTTLDMRLVPAVKVRGRLQAAGTRKGIDGAVVSVQYGGQSEPVVTAGEGRYEARVLPGEVRHQVIFIPDKHLLERTEIPPVTVPADVDIFDLPPIELVPVLLYDGQLVDKDGKPVADAEIMAERTFAKTDAQGKFRLGLRDPPKSFYVQVRKMGYSTTIEKRDPLLLRLPVAIKPPLALSALIKVEGQLIDHDGKPVAKALIIGEYDTNRYGFERTDEEGKFTAMLPRDTESFTVEVNDRWWSNPTVVRRDPLLLQLPRGPIKE